MPKRPRGRPKGSKNKPKTLEGLLLQCVEGLDIPPPPVRPKPKNAKKTESPMVRLAREDPEKHRELSRRGNEIKKAKVRKPGSGAWDVVGKPKTMTKREWAWRKEEARKIANRIYKIMDLEGSLPENPIARKAMKTALEMLAEDNATKDKLSIVRTLLEYNLAKPASAQNVTIKTAEDFLDELAQSEGK